MQKWFKKAKPARSIVPISRFISTTVFALKRRGSYDCRFALDGIDDEALPDEVLSDVITRLHGAWLPQNARLYQYVRIRQGYDIPRQPPARTRLLTRSFRIVSTSFAKMATSDVSISSGA